MTCPFWAFMRMSGARSHPSQDASNLALVPTAPQAGAASASSNSGATWTRNDMPLLGVYAPVWSSVASSADGTKLVAAGGTHLASGIFGTGPIYTSQDSG